MATAMAASTSVAGKGLRMGASRRVAPAKAPRVVRVFASAERPLWFPGNPAPAWLTGELAGDHGFDPLHLSEEPEARKWMVQAELVHGRWAMLGAAGILFTALGAKAGLGFPDWFEAGKVAQENSPIPLGTLIFTELLLLGWAEHKRLYDIYSPGSQADGSFFGVTEGFKGKENGYPGGKFFDPLGFADGSEQLYRKYKENEIKNGRLAMVACVGFTAQHYATGKSPIDNLVDHVASPFTTTFATNGVSVPHFSEFN